MGLRHDIGEKRALEKARQALRKSEPVPPHYIIAPMQYYSANSFLNCCDYQHEYRYHNLYNFFKYWFLVRKIAATTQTNIISSAVTY
jgi:hypothetical protein